MGYGWVTERWPIHYPFITHSLPTRYPFVTHPLPIHYPFITHPLPIHFPSDLPCRNQLSDGLETLQAYVLGPRESFRQGYGSIRVTWEYFITLQKFTSSILISNSPYLKFPSYLDLPCRNQLSDGLETLRGCVVGSRESFRQGYGSIWVTWEYFITLPDPLLTQ